MQAALVEELKGAAERLGIRVREERLLREVGYRVRSGACRLRGERVLFLDRALPPSGQLEVLVEELASQPTEAIYLSPAARQLLARAGQGKARENAGKESAGG